ncbi:LON peptidase substrate-binding domain-containing protein [Wenjunlia vitaminophila]|uniref:LON peptidase substrate-binding domain-containing protein n=1 Tax=Wenjunlia vitaminophila TaxID=76728 RepID=UPI00036CF884|nr:LON peptidase substrate-binding domain-containing protein [Wenjunlia vitaminophila]
MTVRLPLFPLTSVLYPGLVLPLTVFEERYRRLVADLSALPADAPRRFGVVAIRDGSEIAPTHPGAGEGSGPGEGNGPPGGAAAGFGRDLGTALYPVGCVAEVASIRTHPDGRSDLLTSGTVRFRTRSIDATGPYLVAEVEELPEQRGDGAGALASAVARMFGAYQRRLAGAREHSLTTTPELSDDPSVLSYLVAAATVADTSVKQRLLQAPDTAARLADELALLRREVAVLGKLPSLPAVELTRQVPSPN